MRILFAGATGVIGRWTVPRLIADGHEVRAVARNDAAHTWLASLGAQPIRANLFRPAEVALAVEGVDAVINMATAIPRHDKMTKRDSWMINDRLRSEATQILVDAAIAATAIATALSVPSGTYNVSDQRPVTKAEELQSLTAALDARPPRQIPRWLARLVAGRAARLLTVSQRISSSRFTDATGWKPAIPSVTSGWADVTVVTP